MSLFLDIGTGAGLASATGVRPYLPPLLAGGLARGDIGIDFDGTDLWWLESPAFLAGVLALGVIGFLVERSAANRASPDIGGRVGPRARRDLRGRRSAWRSARCCSRAHSSTTARRRGSGSCSDPSVPPSAWLAIGGLVERVRARLEPDQAALVTAYADGAALILAAIAIFVPPLAFLAIPGFVVLLLGGRRREGEKYAGLRILR